MFLVYSNFPQMKVCLQYGDEDVGNRAVKHPGVSQKDGGPAKMAMYKRLAQGLEFSLHVREAGTLREEKKDSIHEN